MSPQKKKPNTKEASLKLEFGKHSQADDNPQTSVENGGVYSSEEAVKAATDYFNGDELAATVWANKYALKDARGNLFERTPDDMHWRMAGEISRIEQKYPDSLSKEEIYEVLKDFKYIVPQGGSMAGIGNDYQIVSLSNCFVIGRDQNGDSYGAILQTDQEQVQLMKRRGGVGHDLSQLRPKGSPVMNSAVTSTGVVPFMERYSNSTREVAQGGRRGALMLTLSMRHPDVEDFIDAKTDTTKVTGANVSIRVDDAFMEAVRQDDEYKLQFPVDADNPQFSHTVKAAELWHKITHNAWKSAEPGILFWDTIVRESIPDCYASQGFKTVSTNPCGEIPLCPYDSCRLLAINLFGYVNQPFTKDAHFDFDLFEQHVGVAQRIMDDIVDLEIEKIDSISQKIASDPEDPETKAVEARLWQQIRLKCEQGRRTGIGVTAEGDMLAALGMKYGEAKAIKFAVKVHKTLALAAYRSSVKLARKRGAFPLFDADKEKRNPFINRIKRADKTLYQEMVRYGRRNIALLTVAPTGTTSLMTQTTSGIEPLFSVSYMRRRKVNAQEDQKESDFVDKLGDSWQEYRVFHPQFSHWLKSKGFDADQVTELPDQELQELVKKSPYHQATANDIDWIKKVEMQGAIQAWVDHSISVTVNVPKETPRELIEQIYFRAWEVGCKGVTVYREGSRDGVLVSGSTSEETDSESMEARAAPQRPKSLPAKIIRFKNHDEQWIAVVGLLNGRPYEIFTGFAEDSFLIPNNINEGMVIKNKTEDGASRYDFQYQDKDGYKVTFEGLSRSFNEEYWNLAKLISGVLRHGMPVKSAVDVVSNLHLDDESLNTWKNGVIRALSQFIPDGTKVKNASCPQCHHKALEYQEGCLTCKNCGYTHCN
jgi:ribonucleoside-diphosphate reductase alpha chain